MGDVDNIIAAALEHNDRIRHIGLFHIPGSRMESVLAAMKQPFPELTTLRVKLQASSFIEFHPGLDTAPVVPASFLVGSAPRLHELYANSFPFPGL